MKYLKKFDEDNYIRISKYKFKVAIDNKIYIDTSIFTNLNNIIKIGYIIKSTSDCISIFNIENFIFIKIYYLEDDWIYVSVTDHSLNDEGDVEFYYKCDQFDGLVHLLKNIEVIK